MCETLMAVQVVRVEKSALDEQVGFVIDENRRRAAVAAAAARASIPEGGGTGVRAAEAVALPRSAAANGAAAEAGRLREFRIRPNLPEGVAAPAFRSARRAERGGGGAGDGDNAVAVEAKRGGKGGRQRKKKGDGRAAGAGQSIEGMDAAGEAEGGQKGGRDARRTSSSVGSSDVTNSRRVTGASDDAAEKASSKERNAYRRRGGLAAGGGAAGEGGLKGAWQLREAVKERSRHAARLQDDRNDDIFDRFVEDVEVLYGDTSAAEKVAGGCG